jgi:hypothetical protein
MSENLKSLYNTISNNPDLSLDIGSFEEFNNKMLTPEDRKSFYDVMAANNVDLGDPNEYESRLKNVTPPEDAPVEKDDMASAGEEDSSDISKKGTIMSATSYSSPLEVITSEKYKDGSYSFFDKSDKEVVADLKELFGGTEGEFNFKQLFTGEGGGLQAVEISTKDGKHSARFDVGIGDIFNLYGGGQYLSKKEGRDKSYKILTDFINKHSTIEGRVAADQRKVKRKEIFSKTNAKKDELAFTEISDINTKFNDGTLFELIEQTIYVPGGGYAGKGGKTVTTKKQPYKKELKQAKEELLYEQKSDDTIVVNEETIKARAKENIINKIEDEKLTEILKDSDLINEYELASKEFSIDLNKDLALLQQKDHDFNFGKVNQDYTDLKTKLEDSSYNFEYSEDEDLVQLEDGRILPKKIINDYDNLIAKLNAKAVNINALRSSIMERAMDSEDNSRARDIARRNYNGLEEFLVETGMGLAEQFVVNIPYGISTLGRSIMGVGPDEGSTDVVLGVKQNMQKIRDSYSKDIEFDDAFKSIGNFGTFAAQELSNQIPIFAALAMPTGLVNIGTSSFGDQYSNLMAEERSIGGRKLSNTAKFWMSLGYSASEVVFEGLTTLPLIRAAKNSFRGTQGTTTLFNTNFKKYFKENVSMFGYGALSEPMAEGMTQISQNAIDGKFDNLTEGLDHAMFSGLMFGTTLSAMPFAKGLYVASLNDGEKTKNIRARTQKIQGIKRTNDLLTRNLDKGTAQDKKARKQKIKDNEARAKELFEENIADMKDQDAKVKTLSQDALYEYITATSQQQAIKLEAEKIDNDNTLNQAEKNERLQELQVVFDQMQGLRDVFRDTKTFGSEWHAYQANQDNKENVKRIKEEALNVLVSEGKKDPSQEDINKKARVIFNSEKIREDHNKNKSAGATKAVLVETAADADAIIDEAIDKRINQLIKLGEKNNVDVSSQINQLEIDRVAYKKGLKQGNHGVTIVLNQPNQKGRPVNNIPITVVENSAKDDRLEVKTHEGGHDVFIQTLSTDPGAYDELASTALTWLRNNNEAAYNRIALKMGNNVRSDEAIMYFLEEVAAGKVDISKNSIGGLFGFLLNKGIEANGGAPIDFKGETDAINFLINIGKKIKDGTLNNEDLRAIRENILIKDGKAEAKARMKTAPKFSETRAKDNLQKIQDAVTYNPNSSVLASELPGMAMAQVNNYFAARPKLAANFSPSALIQAKEELQAEIISRLYTPSKTGRSDINGFDGRGTLYGYLNGRIRFRMLDAFEQNPTIVPDYTQKQIEEERTKLQEELDKPTDLDNTLTNQNITKVNVLQIGKIANKRDDIIKAVNEEGTFREVIDNNEGKVGNIIFNIPENKISNREDNITVKDAIVDNEGNELTKAQLDAGQTGIPVRSEAKKIQDLFNNINNVKDFIKIMPKTNVSEKDADINKLGENIDVSRNTLGRAIGLPNLILEYFYNKKFKPDGKRARSQGKSSQVGLWELKPEFTNLNETDLTKAAEQLQKDLGVGEQSIPRSGKVKSGQFVKGAAVVVSQQASLSAAQRIKEQQIKEAEKIDDKPKVKKLKQETADITAAQSKLAFSESRTQNIYDSVGVVVSSTFEGDLKKADTLLNAFIKTGRHKFVDENSINNFFKDVENILIKELPQGLVTKRILKPSPRVLGAKRNNEITVNGKKLTIEQYYTQKRDELFLTPEQRKEKGLKPLKYGKPFTGKAENFKAKIYGKVFGNSPESFQQANEDGTIKEFNEVNLSMHKQLWDRINRSIKRNPKNARVWGNYLGTVSLITEHPHRLGAEFVGWSKDPVGSNPDGNTDPKSKGWKLYEWEHAMPATRAYLYLLEAALDTNYDFDTSYQLVIDNFKLVALDNKLDKVNIKNAGRTTSMGKGWNIITDSWLQRYFDKGVNIDPKSIEGLDGRTFDKIYNVNKEGFNSVVKEGIEDNKTIDKAMFNSRVVKKPRGITVLDFDDTLATTKSLVKYTTPDGKTGTLNAEQYASTYEDLLDQGYTFDFSDFNKVVKGKLAPLFNKAMKLQGKFGPENMFVLTARPPAAQKPIFDFLKANGLNIPLKNITGLGNSTAEAKALWIADKVADGYNDFYFADDALQNVQAVKNMLDQFDVKSKVQQARLKFSETLNKDFNNILEKTTGIESIKEFSQTQAKIRGKKTKYKSIIPPSAQDFAGLLYSFLGKGKQGEKDFEFFKKSLIDPFARGINELNTARQKAANDLQNLNKQFPDVKKKLYKKVKDFDFTNDQAMRVYLWNKAGFEIPGISKRDLEGLVKIVENDAKLKSYADAVGLISKKENVYKEPKKYWLAENITSDLLDDGAVGDNRALFLQEWQDNVDIIFSDKNLNKIEVIYGSKFREALQDILYRMQTGRSRPLGGGRLLNAYNNWVNNSVGAIMFFNMRSALLQTISATNYINWHDNNPVKAAAAFANQPQYWKDFAFIFNSDFLKQRRTGNRRGINEQELSAAVAGSDNKAKAAIAWLLSKGFLPTQVADSFAIASGGSTFYRNRIKKYVKEGMDQKAAEKQAFLDFQETTEAAQQSARPDMISQQQASPLGRLILAFQNTPMQYARIMNKAARDLNAGRGDYKTHISKIAYYGFIQSVIFSSLQSALFASLGDDEEEEFDKKKMRILNSIMDSMLSGIGFGGKAIGTTKNTIMTFLDQRDRGFRADHGYTILALTSFSPPIGSKLRKVYSSIKTDQYNKDIFLRRGFTLDNPIWQAIGNVVEGLTNVPLGRAANKMLNIDNALDESNEWWQRAALLLGWNTWDLGIRDKDIEELKKEVKKEKNAAAVLKRKKKKEEKEIEKLEAEKAIVEENKKKSEKDGRCSAVNKSGNRCSNKALPGKSFCTIHEKTEQRKDGKQAQCKKIKKDGKRCKMQTSNKSGLCYYHD